MQFKMLALVAALATITTSVDAVAITERSANVLVAQLFTNPNRGGTPMNVDPLALPTGCVNLVGPMSKSISSLEVFNGVLCTFFTDRNCGGNFFSAGGIYIKDLTGTPYNDALSSLSCE